MISIERGVKQVIAQNSRYTYDEINLTDPIDKFISSFLADRLAREIKRKFPNVPTTQLTNKLFVTIKLVTDLVKEIENYYPIAPPSPSPATIIS